MRKRLQFAIFLITILLILTVSRSHAQLMLYDDFSANVLDETKWTGRHSSDGGSGTTLESRREIDAGRLALETRAVGGNTGSTELHFSGNGLLFRNPNTLMEISFEVLVRELEVTTCPVGPPSWATARGLYSLFNDETGDVSVSVEVRRSSNVTQPTNTLEVVAILFHRSPSADTTLAFDILGAAKINQKIALRMKWDPANSRVEIQKDKQAVSLLPYANTVIAPSTGEKSLGVLGIVSDCFGSPLPKASLLAFFDNVRVNP